MTQAEIVAEQLKSASASLILAVAAAGKGDWAAAEQAIIDAQEPGTIAMREVQAKLMEPPTPAEDLED